MRVVRLESAYGCGCAEFSCAGVVNENLSKYILKYLTDEKTGAIRLQQVESLNFTDSVKMDNGALERSMEIVDLIA